MTLKFLGRDSGFGKDNNSAYVEVGDKLILIDCGFSIFNIIREKLDFNRYNSIEIIITHLHNDHAGSLSQLILYLWFKFHKKTTVVSKCERIKEYLDVTGTTEEAYELKEVPYVKFIKTEHVKELDAYGFVLTILDKKILYTGDTAIIEPFLSELYMANEAYIDISTTVGVHLNINEILPILDEVNNKGVEIYLMHMDDKEKISSITRGRYIE